MDDDAEVQLYPPEMSEISWEDCQARIADSSDVTFVFQARRLKKGEDSIFEVPDEPPQYLFRRSIMSNARLVDDPARPGYICKHALRKEQRRRNIAGRARRKAETQLRLAFHRNDRDMRTLLVCS